MSNIRRQDIEAARSRKQSTHVGLWFDKYLKDQKGSTLEPYVDHIQQTAAIGEPASYEAFFTRWRRSLEEAGASLREVECVGRLAAGLGGESVIENGLSLHHTYGVPFIPGSSLKGTARAYAAANLAGPWAEGGPAFRTLFGGQTLPSDKGDTAGDKQRKKARVGIAVFHDALPMPGNFSIHNEVMTVHHPDYYQGKKKPPADWDSPTPIPFPSVSGRFLLAVHAPAAQEWAASGMGILTMALAEFGVGGKTSSGFGRLRLIKEGTVKEDPAEDAVVARFREELGNLANNRVAGTITRYVDRWRTAEVPPEAKAAVAAAILQKIADAGRTKKSKNKEWYKALVACVERQECPS